MQLHSFYVERFRSIESPSKFMISDYTVLVGPNNEGKTNVLRALKCAFNILGYCAFRIRLSRLRQRTLSYSYIPAFRRANYYNWKEDYPIPFQTKGEGKDNNSTFIIEFLLSDENLKNLSSSIGFPLQKKIISIRIQINQDTIRLSLLDSVFYQKNYTKTILANALLFIVSNIRLCFISTERTAKSAMETIEDLIEMRLANVQARPEFQELREIMEKTFKEELKTMSKQIGDNLSVFIRGIKSTTISFDNPTDYHFFPNNRQYDICIDDGIMTPLSQKGSGVQSLVALFLARYVSNTRTKTENFVFVVDEPESHLHPESIHNINDILRNISKNNQVIISTHSPILVQTFDPHKNVIVKDNRAKEASRISEIREILGSRPADNLINAELILIVEGTSDENIFSYLLSDSSNSLKEAIEEKRLVISSAGGTHNLDNYIRFMKNNLCAFHVLVDDDTAGKDIIQFLINEKVISEENYTILKMGGLKHSEIEDLINPEVYAESIKAKYNISSDIVKDILRYKSKWSIKIKNILEKKGKEIKDDDIISLKKIVSEAVKIAIKDTKFKNKIILPNRNESFIELTKCLEKTLSPRKTEE